MATVTEAEHARAAAKLRSLIAAYEEKRDLIQLGAYTEGSNSTVDQAIVARPRIDEFLCQEPSDLEPFESTVRRLTALAREVGG
jgi:flagellum-specific ATP synthase